ncbi:MAG: beta-Ala-His dipeptidase [Clostridia bacterium]|nr:beta-Ala-His dipeptidase [Clostridia bacterium]
MQLTYQGLGTWFEAISAIPRASYHEEKIADFLVAFAKERDLFVLRDEANNVFIRLPATAGLEEKEPLLLQGHTDMVCEKRPCSQHDFSADPLELYEENGWLYARDTTLGADNGAAVAIMLYLLDGADGHLTSHPTIECLFTASEEVGLDGAKAFDYRNVTATRMLNMDSADESLIIAGCAGGLRTDLTLTGDLEPAVGKAYRVCVGGLAGGHSGEDIDRGRANANLLLGRALSRLSATMELRLSSLEGGSKDNAIPRDASAIVLTDGDPAPILEALHLELAGELVKEDRGCTLTAEEVETPSYMMSHELTQKAIGVLTFVPNGIFERCEGLREMVEFSRNLGVIRTENEGRSLCFVFASRSAKNSQLDWSAAQLDGLAVVLGGTTCHHNRYPGWIFAETSALRTAYRHSYETLFGSCPNVTVIHAGLECGIIREKLPHLDIISCGPVVENLHSPDERMNLASFDRFFKTVLHLIHQL